MDPLHSPGQRRCHTAVRLARIAARRLLLPARRGVLTPAGLLHWLLCCLLRVRRTHAPHPSLAPWPPLLLLLHISCLQATTWLPGSDMLAARLLRPVLLLPYYLLLRLLLLAQHLLLLLGW